VQGGAAWLDVTTGLFHTQQSAEPAALIARLAPAEILAEEALGGVAGSRALALAEAVAGRDVAPMVTFFALLRGALADPQLWLRRLHRLASRLRRQQQRLQPSRRAARLKTTWSST
jgi:hypothetical protein